MKRQLSFELEDENYIIKEDGETLFSISGRELKFVSLNFYNGIYNGKSAAIDLTNKIVSDKYGKGKYIFSCLTEIITAIQNELGEDLIEDNSDTEEVKKTSKTVYLYELSACAGDGFFMDGESNPEAAIQTEYSNADYAVKISGKSMEPTIKDGSIVFCQKVDELDDGEIGIFIVNGDVMCKRYRKIDKKWWLLPDNESPKYKHIQIDKSMSCSLLGKVLGK